MKKQSSTRYALREANRKIITDALIEGEHIHHFIQRGHVGHAVGLANDDIKLSQAYNALVTRFIEVMKDKKTETLSCAITQLLNEGWHRKFKLLLPKTKGKK